MPSTDDEFLEIDMELVLAHNHNTSQNVESASSMWKAKETVREIFQRLGDILRIADRLPLLAPVLKLHGYPLQSLQLIRLPNLHLFSKCKLNLELVFEVIKRLETEAVCVTTQIMNPVLEQKEN